ncbi:MAG: hypothetical protein RLZZ234_856, partial [Candidatus Parcubacteria bacterium]
YGHVEKDGTFVRGYHDAMVQAFVGWRLNPEWFIEHFMKGDLEEKLLLNPGTLKRLFMYPYQFEEDLKRCWNLFHHATWKRVQSVPNILVSKRAFGWDYRESVLAPYYTDGYITKNHNLQFESLKIDDRY